MTWVVVEVEEDAPTPTRVDVGSVSLLVIGDHGEWWAWEDRCSHAGCSFSDDGEIDGLTAICNCHGSEFDIRSGRALRKPADRPIRVFDTRVRGGHLEVDV